MPKAKNEWSVQVIPLDDSQPHETSIPEMCLCKIKIKENDYGELYFVHNAFDKRNKVKVERIIH